MTWVARIGPGTESFANRCWRGLVRDMRREILWRRGIGPANRSRPSMARYLVDVHVSEISQGQYTRRLKPWRQAALTADASRPGARLTRPILGLAPSGSTCGGSNPLLRIVEPAAGGRIRPCGGQDVRRFPSRHGCRVGKPRPQADEGRRGDGRRAPAGVTSGGPFSNLSVIGFLPQPAPHQSGGQLRAGLQQVFSRVHHLR